MCAHSEAHRITYMFCRAMDSKRSVMADKDETEKRMKNVKFPINNFESVMNLVIYCRCVSHVK